MLQSLSGQCEANSVRGNDNSNTVRQGRAILMGVAGGAFLAVIFFAGYLTRDVLGHPVLPVSGQAETTGSTDAGFPLLDEVQVIIDRYFVRDLPDLRAQQYSAIRGLLTSLNDPFTFFIDPPVAASESQVLAGTYGGIGVQIARAENGDLLLYPFLDGPAAAAGVQNGDALLRISEMPVDQSIPPDALDQMLRGEVRDNNGVTITLRQVSDGSEVDLFVPFAVINIPSVVWRVLPDDARIGYVQIERFTSRTPDELRTALSELSEDGITALALDLRNNSGGLLQESITVADEFIAEGVLVYERSSTSERVYEADAGGVGIDLPLIVLVNGLTASGAEIVAGALQDSGRALLIGQETYGKGTVQQIFQLSDGSSVHVTSSEWFTPLQQPIDQVGLMPSITMIPDANGRDVELGEAVRQLQALLTPVE